MSETPEAKRPRRLFGSPKATPHDWLMDQAEMVKAYAAGRLDSGSVVGHCSVCDPASNEITIRICKTAESENYQRPFAVCDQKGHNNFRCKWNFKGNKSPRVPGGQMLRRNPNPNPKKDFRIVF
jgi:hypothetical protein